MVESVFESTADSKVSALSTVLSEPPHFPHPDPQKPGYQPENTACHLGKDFTKQRFLCKPFCNKGSRVQDILMLKFKNI